MNPGSDIVDYYDLEMTDEEFALISELVFQHAGIRLRATKKSLVVNRLRPKLRARALTSYMAYYQQVMAGGGSESEIHELVDALTTQKTEFYRNQPHCDFIERVIMPDFGGRLERGELPGVRVWSAGCSTGEEPWTLALIAATSLDEHWARLIKITATDISSTALHAAQRGIYSEKQMGKVPVTLRQRFFSPCEEGWRVGDALRQRVQFCHLNLKNYESWLLPAQHMIVCRNVLIYLDHDLQRAIIDEFARRLTPGGYLVLGHSEVIKRGRADDLEYLSPSLYRKRTALQ